MSYRPEEIEALVRQVVSRVMGEGTLPNLPDKSQGKRPLLDADFVHQLPQNSSFPVPPNALITPLARQAALERHIQLEETAVSQPAITSTATQTIALGADHGGYGLKQTLIQMLEKQLPDYTLVDCGTHSTDSVDYPDYAYAVAQLVGTGRAWRGIIVDGAGIGSCMAANKVPGYAPPCVMIRQRPSIAGNTTTPTSSLLVLASLGQIWHSKS